MSARRFKVPLILAAAVLAGGVGQAGAEWLAGGQKRLNLADAPADWKPMRRMTTADRKAAADRKGITTRVQSQGGGALSPLSVVPVPGGTYSGPLTPCAPNVPRGTPDYFNCPNYAGSPLPEVQGGAISGGIRKFVDTLPGLGPANKNNLGQYIPIATPNQGAYPGSDYYEIDLVQYKEQMHSDLPRTTLRGYKEHGGADGAHYMGPLIIATRDTPVRVKFRNLLPTGAAGNLFLPVDTTMMGAGPGPMQMNGNMEFYKENRATLHLHGNNGSWISDGTPHQWTVPAGEATSYPKGVSAKDVPDMPATGPGELTFYYPNDMSNRLMFYHDHALGITRLNVYAGEAAGYLVTDPVEETLINNGTLPNLGGVYRYGVPLIIQDKTFVPSPEQLAAQDPTWDSERWGKLGDLWFPHVYTPNQNPADISGANNFGRWDYGPWFWPPVTAAAGLIHGAVGINPGTPNPSSTMEAYSDTMLVNGTAYPKMTVQRRPYRFRILNASNDRFMNLSLFYADPQAPTEMQMVPAIVVSTYPATWPTDGRDGGVPSPASAGPSFIQIGTEGGFLKNPAIVAPQPVNYIYNRRDITVLDIQNHALLLGPAERADVIVDFSQVPEGAKLILYNDAPAANPAFDPRNDYYTGDPDLTWMGGAPTTLPGYGPNTRTIMQFTAVGSASPAFNLPALQTALPAAFAASQPPLPVPDGVYSTIQANTLTYSTATGASPITMPMGSKAIQELFELNYGRMNATLGTELPLTNFTTQTTIPLGYIDPPTEFLVAGSTQLWKITHNGVDTHPVHFHLMNVQLVNRVGWDGAIKPPDANELGWKETLRMQPLMDVIVAFTPKAPKFPAAWGTLPHSVRAYDPTQPIGATMGFNPINPLDGTPAVITNQLADFGGEYVWHCHILGHEEMDFMRPMILVAAPEVPTGVTAVKGSSQAVVSFTPGSTGGGTVTYTVTSSPGGITATGTASPITITGLTNGTAYTFTVTATNQAGSITSAASNSVTLGPVPDAPTAVTAVAGNAQATVSFTAPVNGLPLLGANPYTVTSSPGNITAVGAASPIVVPGLTNGTAYTFTVTAVNASGVSPASLPSASITPGILPAAPSSLKASVVAPSYVTLTWTNNANNQTGFYVDQSLDRGLTWTRAGAPTTTMLRVTGLTSRTAMLFRVQAYNATGVSPFANTLSVLTR